MFKVHYTLPALLLTGGSAMAEVPRVITDIAPVHSLVAMVMDGVGTPDLLILPTASPHDFALRPSDVRNLQEADLIVWIGPELTPWLDRPLASVAEGIERLTLMTLSETILREGGHDHDHGEEDHAAEHEDHHGEEDHADHAAHEGHDDQANHDDHAGHDDHAKHDDHANPDDHAGHHEDEAVSYDPHIWLDPQNAANWLPVIAQTLAARDPGNAELYQANATQAAAQINGLIVELAGTIPAEARYITSHAAFGYFEDRFGTASLGSIADGDATAPGPAQVAALRDAAAAANVTCVLVEPQFNAGLAQAVVPQGLTLGQIDGMGAAFPLGATLYPSMIRGIAAGISACVDG